ncbi:hypothetical protein ACMYSN_22255 [Klebsiella sp. R445]
MLRKTRRLLTAGFFVVALRLIYPNTHFAFLGHSQGHYSIRQRVEGYQQALVEGREKPADAGASGGT